MGGREEGWKDGRMGRCLLFNEAVPLAAYFTVQFCKGMIDSVKLKNWGKKWPWLI
jgi:hypothetical protein